MQLFRFEAVGGGWCSRYLASCRKCAVVGCLIIKELLEISKLYNIRADKKKIDQVFHKTLRIEEPEFPAALREG